MARRRISTSIACSPYGAAEQGVTIVIDSDCHRSEMLGLQMDLGIRLARGGWVEPRHVLNTRPLSAVLAWIEAKRNGA
jgi:DNA polymerase (family 10)